MTIIRWIEEGRIKAYKTPGGHRRIMRDDLIVFCRGAGIPTDWADSGEHKTRKVLVVDSDPDTVNAILDDLLDAEDPDSPLAFEVEHAANVFEAGRKLETTRPDIIFLDLDIPGISPALIIQSVKQDPEMKGCRIVGIASHHTPSNIPVDTLLRRPLARGQVRQATGPMPIVKLPS